MFSQQYRHNHLTDEVNIQRDNSYRTIKQRLEEYSLIRKCNRSDKKKAKNTDVIRSREESIIHAFEVETQYGTVLDCSSPENQRLNIQDRLRKWNLKHGTVFEHSRTNVQPPLSIILGDPEEQETNLDDLSLPPYPTLMQNATPDVELFQSNEYLNLYEPSLMNSYEEVSKGLFKSHTVKKQLLPKSAVQVLPGIPDKRQERHIYDEPITLIL